MELQAFEKKTASPLLSWECWRLGLKTQAKFPWAEHNRALAGTVISVSLIDNLRGLKSLDR